MNLYFIAYDHDQTCLDWFISAESAFEAFVMWRAHIIAEDWMTHEDIEKSPDATMNGEAPEVRVFVVPARALVPRVHDWDHALVEAFPLDLDTLATKAVAVTFTTVGE